VIDGDYYREQHEDLPFHKETTWSRRDTQDPGSAATPPRLAHRFDIGRRMPFLQNSLAGGGGALLSNLEIRRTPEHSSNGVLALGQTRPNTQHDPSRLGIKTGFEVNRNCKPAA